MDSLIRQIGINPVTQEAEKAAEKACRESGRDHIHIYYRKDIWNSVDIVRVTDQAQLENHDAISNDADFHMYLREGPEDMSEEFKLVF